MQMALATSVWPISFCPRPPLIMREAWTHGSHVGTERKHVSVRVYNKKSNPTVDFKIDNFAILKTSWRLPSFSKVPEDLQLWVPKQLKNIQFLS